MSTKATIHHRGDGNVSVYEWQNDTITVLLTGAQTGGAFTMTEDNMKPCFCLGMHLHREHAETFHILSGEVTFRIDDETVTAAVGTTIHIPPGVPHGVTINNGQPGRMLMLYSPSGIEHFLAEMKTLTEAQFADVHFMKAFNTRHDNITLDDPSSEANS